MRIGSHGGSVFDQVREYISTQASGTRAYIKQEVITTACSWIPSLPGIAIRSVAYRPVMTMHGRAAIEASVRLRYTENIRLGSGVYLDHGVYLHACPGGISIDDDTVVMHESILHVYNFRNLPQSGIWIGKRCFIGERTVIRGQGGVTIGDDVLIAPHVQILAVDHVVSTSRVPINAQGLSARGIVVEDGAWLGGGAIITDGVRIGRNAVVGAGSVVTHDIPAASVALGVPARVVRMIEDSEPPLDDSPPIAWLTQEREERAAWRV